MLERWAKNALAIAITVRVPHILIKSQFVCNLKSKLTEALLSSENCSLNARLISVRLHIICAVWQIARCKLHHFSAAAQVVGLVF
jgi:hypothetical protein